MQIRRSWPGDARHYGGEPWIEIPRPAEIDREQALVLGLRPERVTLGGASQNSIQARVELVEPTGLGTVVHFESATQSLKMFTTGRPVLEAGETAPISVKTEDIRLFHPDSGARRFRAA